MLQNDMLRFGNIKIGTRFTTQENAKVRVHVFVDGLQSGMQYEAVSVYIYQVQSNFVQLRINTQYMCSQLVEGRCVFEVNTGNSKSPLHYLALVL